ncbi:hypothetical protein MYX07_01550 [Patescibacteria group bacterium AH-259-L07]|nr:hypothetical protein [Patescibacteria group bacterium AH-259-L07]
MSEQQTKTCQNCKNQFTIEPDDFDFYKKINVPPPAFCPECRLQRRLAHRDKSYFLRKCDKCGKSAISMWHPDITGYTFYCGSCWWSDDWDPLEYGRDFDFSRQFFEQFDELYHDVPKHMSNTQMNKNCDYIISAHKNKNCYMADEIDYSEDCYYGYGIQKSKSCVDCHYTHKCEIGYELVKCENCYNTFFAFNSHGCNDSAFLANCYGCSNSLFCINLRNAKNHLFNKPATPDEIAKKKQEIFTGSYVILQKALKEFQALKERSLTKYMVSVNAHNSTGNFLTNCKNCKSSYSINNCINCKYCTDIYDSKDSMDVHIYSCELSYDSTNIGPEGQRYLFCHFCWFSSNITYADECHNSQDLFGCCALRKKNYCILNKQYDKEAYLKLREKIIEHMRKTREWGEYFPVEMSPHGYNHTYAYEFYPLTKEEVLARGWKWLPEVSIKDKYGIERETFTLPDSISDTNESVCKEIFKCEATGRFYRIHPEEYKFLKKYNLPLPKFSPQERDHRRWNQMKPRKLWHRKCQCSGEKSGNKVYQNTTKHFHSKDHCPHEFETTYAPERKEIVYCEKCYQSEIV